jgi:hypothetical protein
VAEHALLSHQVWSWSDQEYLKNKVFVSFMTWLNFDLDLWPWPFYLVWWLLNPWYLYMLTMMILRWKTKKFNSSGKFSFYVMTSPNDVIAPKVNLIWKALIKDFQMRYYTIWYHRYQNLTLERDPWRSGLIGPKAQSTEWQNKLYFHTKFGVDLITSTQK